MASTLTAGDVFGTFQGYYPDFAIGSLSPDTFGGFTCAALITGETAGNITAIFNGDATSFLAGKAISVNGTAYSTITSGPSFDGSITTIKWAYAPGNFNTTPGSNSYTIDIGAGGPSTQTLTPSLFTNSQTFFAATVTQPFFGPSFVGVSTGAGNAAGTTISFSSSGRASGDLLFIAVMTANQAVTISGWTEVATYSPQSRGTAGAAGGVRLTLFSKTSDGTEGNVTTSDSGDIQYAAGLVVRGYSGASATIDTGAGNNVAATTSGSFGGVTTTGSDRLIASFVATDRDAAAASWTPTGYGNLANGAERFDNGTATNTGGGIAIYTGEKASAGATGNITATQAASAAYCWITLALANASAGTQTLTPSPFTNSQTFYGPTVTRGAVTLLPSLVTNSQTFYAPAVSAAYTLSPSLFTNAQSFYSATVTQGAVTLSPTLVTNNQTFYSAAVSASITLSPSLFTNTQTFFGPTVAGSYSLAPALVTNSQTFYAATVAPGTATLTPSLFTNAQTFYGPTVAAGSTTLSPSLVTNSQSFYAPTVTRGTVSLSPALVTNAQTFFGPTVSSVKTLAPALFTNSSTFYGPTVSLASQILYPALFVNGAGETVAAQPRMWRPFMDSFAA
ncbi:MAG: hypothetical protein ACK4S3_02575 [Parvibaculum sp.]